MPNLEATDIQGKYCAIDGKSCRHLLVPMGGMSYPDRCRKYKSILDRDDNTKRVLKNERCFQTVSKTENVTKITSD